MIRGRGELKRDGGLLTFFPRKGGGDYLQREGLIDESYRETYKTKPTVTKL